MKTRDEIIQSEYVEKGRPRKEIASILGITDSALRTYLHRHKITKPVAKKLYESYDWLYEQYIINKKSYNDIAIITVTTKGTIRYWIEKYKIPVRDRDEAQFLAKLNVCNLTEYIRDFIIGELLGDGTLVSHSRFTALYQHGNKHKEYIEWLIQKFGKYEIEAVGRPIYIQQSGVATVYHFATRTYPELKEVYDMFYVGGKKIVPEDLNITPIVLRQWYIGDGYLCKRTDRKENPTIIIATNSFSKEEVDNLISKLSDLSIEAWKWKSKGNFVIYIPYRGLVDFFDFIGPCPKEIENLYGYKWL